MPIPKSRAQLLTGMRSRFAKLQKALAEGPPGVADLPCMDDWRVRDVLAVRRWWAVRVIDWIEAGERGETPETPAPGFRWNETPRLNKAIVAESLVEPYSHIRDGLVASADRAVATVERLDDTALLAVGVYGWARTWPLARWISISTETQWESATKAIRKAVRAASAT